MIPKYYRIMRIDISEPSARACWAAEFGVDQETLVAAVTKVGTLANDVRRELGLAELIVMPTRHEWDSRLRF